MRKPFRVSGEMRSPDKLTAALAYAEAGIPVLACHGVDAEGRCDCGDRSCSNIGKHPISRMFSHGLRSATLSLAKIRRAWKNHPNANVAIVPDDGLVVVDIDGLRGEESIAGLKLPQTASVRTGRGRHLYFEGGDAGSLPSFPEVDYRYGGRGYVVAPPSRHKSGRRYRWGAGQNVAPLPVISRTGRTVRIDFKSEKFVHEGSRNSRLTSLAGLMRHGGLSEKPIETALLGLNQVICQPPLKNAEVRAIARSISQYGTPSEEAFGTMADVVAEDVVWLHAPYFPRGVLTMLEGDPGLGKSHFVAGYAAAITTGTPVPWSKDAKAGNVLLLSAEDDAARVLKPRLEANGAHSRRIRYQKELFSLDDNGIARLRFEIESWRPVAVFIDPIVAFLASGADFNDAGDMTLFLTAIDRLAREFDCAIIIVRHLRKTKDGSAINHGLGSIALSARVRSILLLGRHPDDGGRRALVHVKSNYAEEGPAILFALPKVTKGQPKIVWQGVDKEITAQDLLSSGNAGPGRPPNELAAAIAFLRDFLRDGGKSKASVEGAAEARSITKGTLRRARDDIGVLTPRKGRGTIWSLPSNTHED